MPSEYRICRCLTSRPRIVLSLLTFLLPLVPTVIAFSMGSDAGRTGHSSHDGPILSAWTYLQVATIAYFVFLSASGPPNYLTAYTATMISHGIFMQKLGEPIGITLAGDLGSMGINDPVAPALATYIHHLAVGALTWLMAWLVTEMTKECAQPTSTLRVSDKHGSVVP